MWICARRRIDEKFIKKKFDQEQARMTIFQKQFYGTKMAKSEIEYNPKQYTEHVLTEGTVEEKREMLANLKGKLIMKNKKVTVEC
jgi:hypothetical protein